MKRTKNRALGYTKSFIRNDQLHYNDKHTVLSDRYDFPLTTARPEMPNWFSSQLSSIL